MSQTDILMDERVVSEIEVEKLPPTIQQLTEILAAPDKHLGTPLKTRASSLERWFWLIVIIGIIGVPMFTVGLVQLLSGPQAAVSAESVLDVGDIEATGPTDLCPGESLEFQMLLSVLEPGAFSLKMSTWKESPPATIIFSELEEFPVAEKRTFILVRSYDIPILYKDPATNKMVNWEPGEYARHVYITAVDRNTKPSIQKLSFTIRSDCKE